MTRLTRLTRRGWRIGSSVRSVGLKRVWRIELTRLSVRWREHVGIVFLWKKSTVVRHVRPIAVRVDRRTLLMRRLSSVLLGLIETVSIPLSPSIIVSFPEAFIAIAALFGPISSTCVVFLREVIVGEFLELCLTMGVVALA